MNSKVAKLLSQKQFKQKSTDWFLQRQNKITASEIADILPKTEAICKPYTDAFNISNFKYSKTGYLNTYSNKNEYITKKCDEYHGISKREFFDNEYTLHGKKYEDAACSLYRLLKGKKVLEFGFLEHPEINYIGASPDGITEDGIALEIKCPLSRKIVKGSMPIYYYAQVQLQLEVLDLEECDFLECSIKEVESIETVVESIETVVESSEIEIPRRFFGIAFEVNVQGLNNYNKQILEPNKLRELVEFFNEQEIKYNLFEIVDYQIINVKRSREFFALALPEINDTFNTLQNFYADKQSYIDFKAGLENKKNEKYNKKFEESVCEVTEETESELDFI